MARAKRIAFISKNGVMYEKEYEFEWFMGLSLSQKQKSIRAFHGEIKKVGIESILEVSRKGENELGQRLSAFNLIVNINNFSSSVECLYHASKVFKEGLKEIKFDDCLYMAPKDSKRHVNEEATNRNLKLIRFEFNGKTFKLETGSLCYDYIYILGLSQNEELSKEILKYEAFTDIEYNQAKSVACQARACAKYKYLYEKCLLEEFLSNPHKFIHLY